MTEESLRPYDDPYPGQLRRIRELLDTGVSVLVEHNEFGTRKELVLAPKSGMTAFGKAYGLGQHEWYLLSWVGQGSMWVPLNGGADAGYIAEKLDIAKWRLDAQSIAAFTKSLGHRGVFRAREED